MVLLHQLSYSFTTFFAWSNLPLVNMPTAMHTLSGVDVYLAAEASVLQSSLIRCAGGPGLTSLPKWLSTADFDEQILVWADS